MADSLALFTNASGPLPLETTFKAPSDAPMVLLVSGTVWTSQQNTPIGVLAEVDGQTVGKAQIYANPSETHLAVPTQFIPLTLPIGQHTLRLSMISGETESDENDTFSAALLY